jgi:hypothetical protein
MYADYRLPWGVSSYLRICSHFFEVSSDELGRVARFLPSMIKWGVPFPEAAWAMTVGIPIRQAAIDLGTRFVTEVGSGYRDFVKWLGGINLSDLENEYGLRGLVCWKTSRVCWRRQVRAFC